MPDHSRSIALLRAILKDNCPSDEAARRHLGAALLCSIDPLDYCAHRFGLGNAMVWRRAAHWAGFTFAEQTPTRAPLPRIDRIDHLGQARTLRQPVLGRDVQFIAPSFAQVLNLSAANETLRGNLRFVPPEAIETGIAAAASEQLIAGAQQNVTRLWPRASAAQDLPQHVRIGFAALLGVIVAAVMAAGLILKPVLVPLAAVLLLAPGLMRFLAALPRPSRRAPRLLADSELPVYSVLVPLRDEAGMVPMLARALAALDYPSEKLDIKFVVESRSAETVASGPRGAGRSTLSRRGGARLPAAHQAQGDRLCTAFGPRAVFGGVRCRGCAGPRSTAAGGEPLCGRSHPRMPASRAGAGKCQRECADSAVCRRICGTLRPAAAGACALGHPGAAGRDEQSFSDRIPALARVDGTPST